MVLDVVVVTCTSAAEPAPVTAPVALYPNPTTGKFRIQATGNISIAQYAVQNVLGGLVIKGQSLVKQELDLSAQPAGTYWVSLHLSDGKTISQKLVKF